MKIVDMFVLKFLERDHYKYNYIENILKRFLIIKIILKSKQTQFNNVPGNIVFITEKDEN